MAVAILVLDSPHDNEAGRFGTAVATLGDVNGDGYVDLAVGAIGPQMEHIAGVAFIYLGAAMGLSETPSLSLTNPRPERTGSGFGSEIAAAGDVDGDGYADMIMGANAQSAPENLEGNAFVYLGSASGFTDAPDVIFDNPDDQGAGMFGYFVSSGDLNGDGFDDLAVGALRQDLPEHDEGGTFVYMGTPTGPEETPSITLDNPRMMLSSPKERRSNRMGASSKVEPSMRFRRA